MAFKKAKAEQARLKLGFYGPQGSGKTFTALLVAEGLSKADGKRVAFVDTERGTDFYAKEVKERPIHPAAFDFDALYTKSLADVIRDVKALDPNKYSVVVIDSISHLWDAAMNSYSGPRTSKDGIPLHAWAAVKRPYKNLINFLIESPFHVIICGREKKIFKEEGGELQQVGVGMRAEGETEYEPHFCGRFESRKSREDSARSTVVMIVEKDRTGMLQGRTLSNPTFEAFRPMLSLLGTEQAKMEDAEEVAAKDAALLEQAKKEAADKAAASQAMRADFQKRIAEAATLEALAAIGKEIGKVAKTKLLDEDRELLKADYNSRSQTLTA